MKVCGVFGQNGRGILPLALGLLGVGLMASPSLGQAIARDRYIDYLPLEYPSLVQQTAASEAFQLFGDRSDPGYRDLEPVDGIDDRRGELLAGLGARFGPIMVLNTTNLPMDFRRFMDQSNSFNLHVDTWSRLGNPKELLRTQTVSLHSIVGDPCPGGLFNGSGNGYSASGDCLLTELLAKYHPWSPDYQTLSPRTHPADSAEFEVLFFDFPGEGPESWKEEFENGFSEVLPQHYTSFLKVYMHPFIDEIRSPRHGVLGYEFVLQFYFFYPTNDGGNNHEGDWEHINVYIAPRSGVDRLLTAAEVQRILAEGANFGQGEGDPLVTKSVDYYFHYQVFNLDYSSPNVYLDAPAWKAQMQNLVPERSGQENIWKWQRYTTWWDAEETILNTHPICFVGADNKGWDQVLASPGGKNRDSHGTYPYSGLYKDVGPGGATEQINSTFDPREYFEDHGGDISGLDQKRFGRGDAVPYTTTERIEVLPDWERVVQPVMNDPVARRDWFWMLIPVRWGYPATESPFAGVIGNADTGNLSPLGPMFQPHWNRMASRGGAHSYEPHVFETLFPLGLQDTFVNSWGYMNLTLPVIASLPPIDFVWRLAAYPFRRVLKREDGAFFPRDRIPTRFVGFTAGVSKLQHNEEIVTVMLNSGPGIELLTRMAELYPQGVGDAVQYQEKPLEWWWQVSFYLGDKFATQNTLLYSRSDIGFSASVNESNETMRADSEFVLWEYAGSFRFSLTRSAVRPFIKAGYGWTWYRAESISLNGEVLDDSQGVWIHEPSFRSLSDMLPNSWHIGAGVELFGRRSVASFPRGTDISLVFEATYTRCNLGLDDWLLIVGSEDLRHGLIETVSYKRVTLNLGLNLGF